MSYPFVPGYAGHTSGPNGPITRIVMHATVSPCKRGGAMEVARYFQSSSSGGLAHYVVDPGEVVQCCHDDTACWHAPPNKGSIGVELCDPQDGNHWADPDHEAMLHLAAKLVADLCKTHGVPIVYVDAAGLKAGKHGITKHIDVSHAFGQSSHTDPDHGGIFPTGHFIELVQQAAGTHPAPKPAPKPAPAKTYPTLREGDQGPNVRRLQTVLHLPVDGIFGPKTKAAVMSAQKAHHLAVDGIAGPATLKSLGY